MQLLQNSPIVPSPILPDSSLTEDFSTLTMYKGRSPQLVLDQRSRVELPDIHQPKSLRNSLVLHVVANKESGSKRPDQSIQATTNLKSSVRKNLNIMKNTSSPSRKELDYNLSSLKSITSLEKLDLISKEFIRKLEMEYQVH